MRCFLSIMLVLSMIGCGKREQRQAQLIAVGEDKPQTSPTPSGLPRMQPVEEDNRAKGLSAVRQDGRHWVDEKGQKLRLRGTNIGNWLQLEFWMMDSVMNIEGVNIADQCTLEGELERRFGPAEKERLMAVFRDSWMTPRDWDVIQSMGFNLVRLPFMYNLIEDQYHPFQLRADAWVYLDRAIDEAEKRGMYTILDLHGAVGSQGWEHHSGCAGKNQLWGSNEYRERTKWLWKQIAERYKDRKAVAGYGLLNEPWGTDAGTLANFSRELYEAIRTIDRQHVIILPGHNTAGIDAYGDPLKSGMRNIAFEMHFYPGFWGWGEGQDPVEVHRDWLFCGSQAAGNVCAWNERLTKLNTPFLVGEFQPWTALGTWGPAMTRIHYDVYNARGWAATSWSYKTVSRSGSSEKDGWNWGLTTNLKPGGDLPSLDIRRADKKNIEDYFRRFATQPLLVHEELRKAMNANTRTGQRIEAEFFESSMGVSIEKTAGTQGGLNVGYTDDKDWMNYPIHIEKSGAFQLELRVASPYSGGQVILGRDGQDLVRAAIPHTGDWQNWTTITVPVNLEAGEQSLTLWVEKGGWNFDWWSLRPMN